MTITNEVRRLRKVMVCRPGTEWSRIRPLERERLLVDDTLWQVGAEREHQTFRTLLTHLLGPQAVLDMRTLLVQAMKEAKPSQVEDLIDSVVLLNRRGRRLDANPDRLNRLHDMLRKSLRTLVDKPQQLVEHLIAGVPMPHTFAAGPGHELDLMLDPVPNLMFARDPLARIGSELAITSMAHSARWREPILAGFVASILKDVDLGSRELLLDGPTKLVNPDEPTPRSYPTMEGGDILVLSSSIVACGWSERSNLDGARELARGLRRARIKDSDKTPFETLVVVRMPRRRATMHLDTIFSMCDEREALVYPRMLLPGAAEQVTAYAIDLTASPNDEVHLVPMGAFLDALSSLEFELKAIPAGGRHPLHQDREQWTDGANVLALRPGLVIGYERNRRTSAALSENGYEIASAEQMIALSANEAEAIMSDNDRKIFIALAATELTRARGGPHCLSRDLVRDP